MHDLKGLMWFAVITTVIGTVGILWEQHNKPRIENKGLYTITMRGLSGSIEMYYTNSYEIDDNGCLYFKGWSYRPGGKLEMLMFEERVCGEYSVQSSNIKL